MAAQVQGAGGGLGNDVAQGGVGACPEDHEAEVWGAVRELADEFGKMFDGPSFIAPPSTGLEDDPAGGAGPFALHFGGNGWAGGQPVKGLVHGDAKPGENGQVPVHRVGVVGQAGDGEVVKSAGTFADFVETNELPAVGEPGKNGAAGEALEVNDEVEILLAELADAAKHFGPVAGLSPAAAFEADDAGEVGVSFEEGGEGRVNPPMDLGVGPVALEQTQDGQRLDDVAKGTGFEDENFQVWVGFLTADRRR